MTNKKIAMPNAQLNGSGGQAQNTKLVAFDPKGLEQPRKLEHTSSVVTGSEGAIARKHSEVIEALTNDRVEGNATSVDRAARKEWVRESGIPNHLYELNTRVGKLEVAIAADTGFPVLGNASTKKDSKGRIVKATGLDISKGWWKVQGYDWQKDCDRLEQAQYKTLSKKSTGKDGQPLKYVSKIGSGSQAYTLRVSEAEIQAVSLRWGVEFPYSKELADSPASVSHLYWKWVLTSKIIPVVVTEGAKKSASLIGQGIPAIALPGVWNIWSSAKADKGAIKKLTRDLQYLRADNKPVFLAFDSDAQENEKVHAALKEICTELSKPLGKKGVGPLIKILSWTQLEGKGIDDVFVSYGESFVQNLFEVSTLFEDWKASLVESDWFPHTLANVLEKTHQHYFMTMGEDSAIYRYQRALGVYAPCPTAVKIVAQVLDGLEGPEADAEKGKGASSAGHPDTVAKMMKAIRQHRVIDPEKVNPPMHWCTSDGVLSLKATRDSNGYNAVPYLAPHAPYTGRENQIAFTDASAWKYEPGASRSHLERLLQFIPDKYRDALMDTIACSLDMPSARAMLLRKSLPGIFLKGGGQNGKDSLRNILELLHISNKANVNLSSISDHDFDTNRFAINGLDESTCINFSSENKRADISKLETLKALVTGDPVRIADKGVNARSVKVTALHIFCTNRDMIISDTGASIRSRYSVMTLPYMFVDQKDYDAGTEEEKKSKLRLADPAFGDRAWLAEHVMPALFNELLERLVRSLNRGEIDWSACAHEFSELADESDHIKGFLNSEFVNVTNRQDDFSTSSQIYSAYMQYCVDIERAVIKDGLTAEPRIVEADPSSTQAKHDPLCSSAAGLSQKIGAAIEKKSIQKKQSGKPVRGFVGILV